MKGLVIGGAVFLLIAVGAAYFFSGKLFPQEDRIAVPPTYQQTEEKQEVENVLTIDSNLAIGSDSSVSK